MKPILALDASGKTAGVCLLQDGTVLYSQVQNQGLTHSQTLLPFVAQALKDTQLTPGDLGALAVTAGPGSFTGLRIGMALAKGLALPRQLPLAPVSTLEAWALASHLRGVVIPALDARRGEVYWAAFRCEDGLTRLHEDSASAAASIPISDASTTNLVFFVGDGAELCYNVFNCCPNVAHPPAGFAPNVAEGAAFLAADMLQKGDIPPAATAVPRYLRLSQAERERKARMGEA